MNYSKLGDVAEFINGYAFKPTDWENEGRKIIRIQNLTDKEKTFNKTTKAVSEKYIVRKGDLLISWSATLGIFEWLDQDEALLNQHIFKVILNSNLVKKKYFMYVLRYTISKMFQYTHGSTMKHIVRGDFLKHEIPLPSLEEQDAVSVKLEKADSNRQKRNEAINLLDQYVKSTFLDLFGDPVVNNKKWDRIPLSQLLFKIESGRSPVCLNRPVENGEWGVLKLGAVTKCIYKPNENKALTETENPNSAIEVKKGDVLFSRKNTYELVAACAYVWDTPSGLMLPDLIFRLVIKDKTILNPIFLQALLSFPSKRKTIQSLAGGAAGSMPNISKAKLLDHNIEVPPILLQTKFAEIVQKSESLKQKMLNQAIDLDIQFQSLMQKSFS